MKLRAYPESLSAQRQWFSFCFLISFIYSIPQTGGGEILPPPVFRFCFPAEIPSDCC